MTNPAMFVVTVFELARDSEQENLTRVRDAYNATPSEGLRALLCIHHKRFMAACAVVEALTVYSTLTGGK